MIVLLVLCLLPIYSQNQDLPTLFADLVARYNRSYQNNSAEYTYRYNVFLINYYNVQNLNSDSKYDTVYELNQRFDWTQQQSIAVYNPQVDLSATTSSPMPALRVRASQSIDWRGTAVSPVKDQGGCGSCWDFSSVASFQSLFMQTSNTIYDLSEQYVLECTGSSDTCNGGYPEDVFNFIIKNNGIPTQTLSPYVADSLITPSTGACRIKQFISLPAQTKYSEFNNVTNDDMMNLLSVAPVTVYFKAESAFNYYRSGTYRCSGITTTSQLNHAVQVVGYNTNSTGTYYIIKNQWGTSWGINGFAYIDSVYDCGIKLKVMQVTANNNKQWLLYLYSLAILIILAI